MMFYTTVARLDARLCGEDGHGHVRRAATPQASGAVFNGMLANPGELIGWMLVAVVHRAFSCAAWACRTASSASPK